MDSKFLIEGCLKSIASKIPIISDLASTYFDWKNQKEMDNIKLTIEEFAVELERLESRINVAYLRSEDYCHIFQKSMDKAKNEINESKRKLFSKFLTISCFENNYQNPNKVVFIEILDKLQLSHIQTLTLIYKNFPKSNEGWNLEDVLKIEGIEGDRKENLELDINYINYLGLISVDISFNIVDGNLIQYTGYKFSKLGYAFISFLEYSKY